MKILPAVLVFGAILPTLALAQTTPISALNPESEKAALKLEHDLSAALTKPDGQAVEGMLAEEFYLVTPDGATQSKEEFVDDVETGDLKLESNKRDDLKVRLATEDFAVVTYRTTDKGTSNNKDISGQCRWTDVLVKRDGRWMVLVAQGTALMDNEP